MELELRLAEMDVELAAARRLVEASAVEVAEAAEAAARESALVAEAAAQSAAAHAAFASCFPIGADTVSHCSTLQL